MSLHLTPPQLGTSRSKKPWEPLDAQSCLYWVLDGVVIATRDLPITALPISIAVFVPATDLKLDASGFGVVQDEVAAQRVQLCCEGLSELIQAAELDLSGFRSKLTENQAKFAVVAIAAGALLIPFDLLHGGFALGAGIVCAFSAGSEAQRLVHVLEAGLQTLKSSWQDVVSSNNLS